MLYITATPIGNLSDITARAAQTLHDVPLIIAENPTHTQKLLQALGVKGKRVTQFAEHNEHKVLDKLISELKTTDACLVTDAGTPGISDPGFRLVRACIENGITVVPLPGANAAIAALAASGLPTDRFLFVGFLPKTEPKLQQILKTARQAESTLIAYDSPQRILKTLATIEQAEPSVHVVIARELTKLHEEFLRGTSGEVIEQLKAKPSIKGEITLLISFK
jgi:16S rRNA (cytidine1402-2'-O)-methyltransferase